MEQKRTVYKNEQLTALYKELVGNTDPYTRADICAKIVDAQDKRAVDELIQTAGLDNKGEVKMAALATHKDKVNVIKSLKKWANDFGEQSTSGGNPKMSPLLALAIVNDYDIEKALDFDFDGKEPIISDLKNSNYERASEGVDRIGFLITWFMALDDGNGDKFLIEKINQDFPGIEPIFESILKWMEKSL